MTSIVITGFNRHARYLERLLNRHVRGMRAVSYDDSRIALVRAAAHALHADASVTFGGPEPKALIRAICEARRKPLIHVWAGSDVLTVARSPMYVQALRLFDIVHWTSGPQLVDELACLGIAARYVPLASAAVPDTIAPLPAQFTVLTYLPEPRRDFYGQPAVWEEARALPDIRFVVVGAGRPEPGAPPNMEYVGEVRDMNSRIDAASVLLRLPQHDSLSQGVVEALARGRHVIWTYELPGAVRVQSSGDALAKVQALYEQHCSGSLAVNHAGIEYARAHHEPASIAQGVAKEIREAIAASAQQAPDGAPSTRVAISGTPTFSSRVVENCREYGRSVTARVLRTHTTSDTAVSFVSLLTSDVWYSIGQPEMPAGFEFAARAARKRRIIHWLGNDVDALAANPSRIRQYRSGRFMHLAQDEEAAGRLERLGLSASVVSLAALPRVEAIAPLPERFTLLLYLPAQHSERFGRYQYERLMTTLASEPIHYIVVGGGSITLPAGISAERLGWRHDLRAVYERATALVRFTQPDSFSAMVIEVLLHGRYVFCSNDFPFTIRMHDYHDLESGVRSLLARHQQGVLVPQTDAAAVMRPLYSPETCLRSLADACS